MDENCTEKIKNFGDMVEATERLTKPWRKAFWLSNIIWGIIVLVFIAFAYLTPVDFDQQQNLDEQTQTQSYSEGVTSGK